MEKQFLFVDVANPTWLVYVSVLVLAVFFRFSRIFSVRNLDVLLMLMLSTSLVTASAWKSVPPPETLGSPQNPGLTMAVEALTDARNAARIESGVVQAGGELPSGARNRVETAAFQSESSTAVSIDETPRFHPLYQWSSAVLLAISLLLLIRLVFDESLTRRPRLEQNLNQAGLTFLCIPAGVLLAISVFVITPPKSTVAAVERGKALLQRMDVSGGVQADGPQNPAPTETLLAAGAAGVAQLSAQLNPDSVSKDTSGGLNFTAETLVAQILVVISHLAVVLGLLYIGKYHFSSEQLGLSMSCLYLLLPCTAFHVHQLSHVLPGACLTWAIASYRKPVVSGVLLGLACGTLFFAVFLLPLWAAFYGRRGALRFGLSLICVAAVLVGCLLLTSSNADSFVGKLVMTMNWTVYRLLDEASLAAQTPFGQIFVRIPLAALFFVMLTAMTVLPRPRNLENLLANSAALVVAAQLWYPDDIGTYVLWYLPLLLLVIFRPRLDRFVPPEILQRGTVSVAAPIRPDTVGASSASRMTLYQ